MADNSFDLDFQLHFVLRRTVLSYSIELEFIIKYEIGDYLKPDVPPPPDWELAQLVRKRLAEYLQRFGLKVAEYRLTPNDLKYWIVEEGKGLEMEKFTIGLDKWGFCPVKLISPVHRYGENLCFFQIDRALTLIKDGFLPFVNSSCSFAIHVGNVEAGSGKSLESMGFIFHTVQNFMIFVVAFQAQIDCIHPPERADGLRCISAAGLHPRTMPSLLIQRIKECKEMQSLYGIWDGAYDIEKHGGRALAYSLKWMTPRNDDNLFKPGNGTIRFGQHAGTLNIDDIYHWVITIGNFVRTSERARVTGWPLYLRLAHFDGTDPIKLDALPTVDFLKALGARQQAEYYAPRIIPNEIFRQIERERMRLLELGD